MSKFPQLRNRHKAVEKRMKMAEPVADNPVAKRMLDAMGDDGLALMRTFQQYFGAKLVHYQDEAGELGKKPGWVE
jgi:hypothetical protein